MNTQNTHPNRIEELIDNINESRETSDNSCQICIEYSGGQKPYQLYFKEDPADDSTDTFKETLGEQLTREQVITALEIANSALQTNPTKQAYTDTPLLNLKESVSDEWDITEDPFTTKRGECLLEYYSETRQNRAKFAILIKNTFDNWEINVHERFDDENDTDTHNGSKINIPLINSKTLETREKAYEKAIEYSEMYAETKPARKQFKRTNEYHERFEEYKQKDNLETRINLFANLAVDMANKQNIQDLEGVCREIAVHDIVGTAMPMYLGEAFEELAAFTEIKDEFEISQYGGNEELINEITMPSGMPTQSGFTHVVYYGLQTLWSIALYEKAQSIKENRIRSAERR